ncbi:hypothetical protein H7X46_07480 [Pseudonocardia sp. C8]|uniref:hypothetical protein n=1 Tax=Pseudonocardia sp. C8 TaxID=2762759 RepID=UPI00164234E3|nr:hypothetical protein [Pseudonocardia sp. C8]MBC3190902.1 hypothetical protein [Pseudonocardia sp. C8]
MADTTDALSIYLNDHLGGANAGIELARQLEQRAGEHLDPAVLTELAEDIEADRDVLRSLIGRIEASTHPVKQLVGWIAGQAQRLAANELLTGREDLSLLLQCEMLALGIEGKRALWEALVEIRPDYPELADVDLDRLVDRAQQQRTRIESVRREFARRSFVPS